MQCQTAYHQCQSLTTRNPTHTCDYRHQYWRIEAIPINMPVAEVATIFEQRNILSASVVDEQESVVGRITIEDVLEVVREEADHAMLTSQLKFIIIAPPSIIPNGILENQAAAIRATTIDQTTPFTAPTANSLQEAFC
jgi:CBS domain-containing protein